MKPLLTIDLLGFWIGIFLTFCILSYLYKDNPFYKLAEHLFVGISLGAVTMQTYYNTLRPNLIDRLADGKLIYLVPLALVLMMFIKGASPKLAWLGRYPLAIIVALFAGLQINAMATSNLTEQIKISGQSIKKQKVDVNSAGAGDLSSLPGLSPSVAARIVADREANGAYASLDDVKKRLAAMPEAVRPSVQQLEDFDKARGSLTGLDANAAVKPKQVDWFGSFSRLLLLIGLCASLVYFYFSIEQKGAIGKVARFGVYVLMIGFGASFGMTVQGRLALAVGRAMDIKGDDKTPAVAAVIHGPVVAIISVIIIVAGLIYFEMRSRRTPPPKEPGSGDTPPEDDLPAY